MRKYQFLTSVLLVSVVGGFCLSSLASTSGRNSPVRAESEQLCKELSKIQRIPFKDEPVDSEVYNRIMGRGKAALPCLINSITDLTRMKDPRTAPTYPDFRVGDLAFILLVRITRTPFEQMLPDQVKSRMSAEGVYAYFQYVQRPTNRRVLQRKWRVWLKENSLK